MNALINHGLLALSCLVLSSAHALDPSPPITVSTVLNTATSWDGKPLEYPAGQAVVTGMVIEIAPGAQTGWHLHSIPSFALVLEGELEVRLKDGSANRLQAGQALAEVVNTLHNGRNVGSGPVKLVVFYTGAQGKVLSEKEPGQ